MTVPPRDNLKRFIREGADLVTMSGGKIIRGPQATGLLYGRADLIEAAHLNSSPNHSMGRPSKVAKEEMVGMYAALRGYMDSDEDELLRDFHELVEIIVDDVGELDDIRATVEFDDDRYFVPTAVIGFEPDWTGPGVEAIADALLGGDPPIYVKIDSARRLVEAFSANLQPGEPEIIGQRLREVLTVSG